MMKCFFFCFVFFSGQTLIRGVNESEILLDHAAAYTLMHIYFAKFQCIHRYLMKCVPINSVLRIAGSILQLMPTLQTYLNAGLSELCIASWATSSKKLGRKLASICSLNALFDSILELWSSYCACANSGSVARTRVNITQLLVVSTPSQLSEIRANKPFRTAAASAITEHLRVVVQSLDMRQCEKCGKREFARERSLKRCAQCKIVLYCSEKCQKDDWTRHKRVCRPCKNPKSLPKCGICGNRKGPFMRTECCNRLVCDDESSYQLGSYARVHCSRNHRRYSICCHHYDEHHKGKWQNCKKCKKEFREKDGSLGYTYASMAGNPPHLPFKFNFDEDAQVFDWGKMNFPKCGICRRDVDTQAENFYRCFCRYALIQCEECMMNGKSLCTCWPKMQIINSMLKN